MEAIRGNLKNKEIRDREEKTGRITYQTLAELVGDMILCNNMADRYAEQLELISGDDENYYTIDWEEISREEYEQLEEEGKEVNSEPKEIYQYFIITDFGANFLQSYTNEIVFYDNELDIYVWGITHCGTSWDYVFTDIPCKKQER